MEYAITASVLMGFLSVLISILAYKTDIRLYWKETLTFFIIYTAAIIYIFWIIMKIGHWFDNVPQIIITLIMPVIYAPLFLYEFFLFPLFYTLFRKKHISTEYSEFTRKDGINANVIIVDRMKNAYSMGISNKTHTIVIGQELIDGLSHEEICGILYHEMGHLKYKHIWLLLTIEIVKLYLFIFAAWIAVHLAEGNLYIYLSIIGVAGGLLPFTRMPIRYCERKADCYAASKVGTETYISALCKLNEIAGKKMDNFDIEHPKLKDRIKHINSCGVK